MGVAMSSQEARVNQTPTSSKQTNKRSKEYIRTGSHARIVRCIIFHYSRGFQKVQIPFETKSDTDPYSLSFSTDSGNTEKRFYCFLRSNPAAAAIPPRYVLLFTLLLRER